MKITAFKHEGVLFDGTFKDKEGVINVNGGIIFSELNGGCGLEGCHCSDGHWLVITKPRTNHGIVDGITVAFEDMEEMTKFINDVELDFDTIVLLRNKISPNK